MRQPKQKCLQVFPPRDELSKTSSGLLEFQSIHEAVVALIQLNHRKLSLDCYYVILFCTGLIT